MAHIAQYYPELLIPSDYDTGTRVDTTYSAVKSVGVNIWDEQWKNGYYQIADGTFEPSAQHICSENLIPVKPNTTYYTLQVGGYVIYYDINGSYLGYHDRAGGNAFSTPPNCHYIHFNCGSAYGAVYLDDIQICLNSLPDAIKQTYHPYMTATLPLPTPVTLRSAGTVAEVYDLETGEKTNPLKDTTMGTGWGYSNGCFRKSFADRGGNYIVCPAYVNGSSSVKADKTIWTEYLVTATDIVVRDDSYNGDYSAFSTAVKDIPLIYALATPDDPTQLDPVENPYIATEAGGTISSILTDPVDDNMNLGYLNL